MIAALTYNCNPESLGDIPPEAFVDAFENEVYAKPQYRETSVRVTFDTGRSRLTSIATDEWDNAAAYALLDSPALNDEIAYLAERAFNACCI